MNDAAGFSIVKYTAAGAANVGHGLSSAPELIITKNIDASEQWFVYAEPVGTQKFLGLIQRVQRHQIQACIQMLVQLHLQTISLAHLGRILTIASHL